MAPVLDLESGPVLVEHLRPDVAVVLFRQVGEAHERAARVSRSSQGSSREGFLGHHMVAYHEYVDPTGEEGRDGALQLLSMLDIQ